MSDLEFDILDELYFVTSWRELAAALHRPTDDAALRAAVIGLPERNTVQDEVAVLLADSGSFPVDGFVQRAAVEELVKRGHLRTYFPDADSEFAYQPMLFGEHYQQMLYLATKAGLLAHNERG